MTSLYSRLYGRPRLRSLSPAMMIPLLLLMAAVLTVPVDAAGEHRKKGILRYLHTGQGGLIDAARSTDPRVPLLKGALAPPKWDAAPIPLDLLIPIRYLKPPARPPRR
ncbi:MAG: hypothetical protein ACYSUU_00965 [Planctomycetota bacterium]|jgi:hypothetical protein